MAAFRHAAKRLVVGGQRRRRPVGIYEAVVSPLVEVEQRRLLLPGLAGGGGKPGARPYFPRRCMSTSTGGAGAASYPQNVQAPQQPCAKPLSETDERREYVRRQVTQIEHKKRELFYLLSDLDVKFPTSHKLARDDRELIHHLFKHVEPNPSDPLWRFNLQRERFNKCIVYGMPTLLATWIGKAGGICLLIFSESVTSFLATAISGPSSFASRMLCWPIVDISIK